MTKEDKLIENLAEHVIDIVERKKHEGRALFTAFVFYMLFFILIMLDRTVAGLIALVGALGFWMLFNHEQSKTRIVRKHVRQLERENEPRYVTNARLIVDMHEDSLANAVTKRCWELKAERDEKA